MPTTIMGWLQWIHYDLEFIGVLFLIYLVKEIFDGFNRRK